MQTYKRIGVSVFVLHIFIEFLAKENYASSFQVEGEVAHKILEYFWFYLLLVVIKGKINMKS